MEYYYKQKHPFYKTLPPYRNDCTNENSKLMDFISPKENEVYAIKKDFDGSENSLVFKLIHAVGFNRFNHIADKPFRVHIRNLRVLPGLLD